MKPAVRPHSGDAYRALILRELGGPTRAKRAAKVIDEAMQATKEGKADHATRLAGVDRYFTAHGIKQQSVAKVDASFNGPVVITWKEPNPADLKSSLPSHTNGSSTNGSNGTTSSSSTEDSGRPSWL